MLLKITIVPGMGVVTCQMPAFQLNESAGKKMIFVAEMTPALKELKDFGMITIDKGTSKEYRDFLVKVSENADRSARARRVRQLRKRMETGGVETVVLGSGVVMTIDPGDTKPDVIKKEAAEQLKALEATQPPPIREDAIPFVDGTGKREEDLDDLPGF